MSFLWKIVFQIWSEHNNHILCFSSAGRLPPISAEARRRKEMDCNSLMGSPEPLPRRTRHRTHTAVKVRVLFVCCHFSSHLVHALRLKKFISSIAGLHFDLYFHSYLIYYCSNLFWSFPINLVWWVATHTTYLWMFTIDITVWRFS